MSGKLKEIFLTASLKLALLASENNLNVTSAPATTQITRFIPKRMVLYSLFPALK